MATKAAAIHTLRFVTGCNSGRPVSRAGLPESDPPELEAAGASVDAIASSGRAALGDFIIVPGGCPGNSLLHEQIDLVAGKGGPILIGNYLHRTIEQTHFPQ